MISPLDVATVVRQQVQFGPSCQLGIDFVVADNSVHDPRPATVDHHSSSDELN